MTDEGQPALPVVTSICPNNRFNIAHIAAGAGSGVADLRSVASASGARRIWNADSIHEVGVSAADLSA
jgi:hypothetical protein